MLHVEGADDVDARLKQLFHVHETLRVARSRRVRVRQLVHHDPARASLEDAVHVQLRERHALIEQLQAWEERQLFGGGHGVLPTVSLEQPNDGILAITAQVADFS